jgi:hypothetical protein
MTEERPIRIYKNRIFSSLILAAVPFYSKVVYDSGLWSYENFQQVVNSSSSNYEIGAYSVLALGSAMVFTVVGVDSLYSLITGDARGLSGRLLLRRYRGEQREMPK